LVAHRQRATLRCRPDVLDKRTQKFDLDLVTVVVVVRNGPQGAPPVVKPEHLKAVERSRISRQLFGGPLALLRTFRPCDLLATLIDAVLLRASAACSATCSSCSSSNVKPPGVSIFFYSASIEQIAAGRVQVGRRLRADAAPGRRSRCADAL
jgi:hypothetical protein